MAMTHRLKEPILKEPMFQGYVFGDIPPKYVLKNGTVSSSICWMDGWSLGGPDHLTQEPIDWRYDNHIRPEIKAFISGNIEANYGQQYCPNVPPSVRS